MDKKKELPKRKALRIKQYDYSSTGAYFITICIKERKQILSEIVKPVGVGALDYPLSEKVKSVGVGALDDPLSEKAKPVGGGALDAPRVKLTEIGKIVEKNLLSSENITGVKIDKYVIMPDHIHAIIVLNSRKYTNRNGSSRAPTPTNAMLPRIVSTFKRFCNKELKADIFQRGYIEHIVRNGDDYVKRVKYIYENPMRWYYENLYSQESNKDTSAE